MKNKPAAPAVTTANKGFRIGKGSPNAQRMTIHFINPSREGSSKGSNIFETTRTLDGIKNYIQALRILKPLVKDIRKAYWNNHLVVIDGMFQQGWED